MANVTTGRSEPIQTMSNAVKMMPVSAKQDINAPNAVFM